MLIGVLDDLEFLRVGVITRIDPDFVDPFGRFHRRLGLEMNVGNDRHVAAALAQTARDMLQVRCVFHRRRGDADYLAASRGQFHRLRDGRFRVHGVAGDHRLHANRIFAANPDPPDLYLARHTPLI